MEYIMEYLVEDGYVMVAVLYILAEMIKRTELMDKRFIPVLLMVISLVITPLVIGGYTPDHLVQAVLVTGVTVWAYEAYDKTIKEENV